MSFNSPFPFPNSKQKIFTVLSLSVFVYLFLTVFEPFGISEIDLYKPLILVGYGFITLMVSVLLFFLAPIVLPKYFDKEKWTVKKTIFFVFWELLLIAILNWLYTISFEGEIIDREFSFFQFIFYTLAVGALAVSFLIMISEHILNYRNQTKAQQWTTDLSNQLLTKKQQKGYLSIGKENSRLQLSLQDLLCIHSDGNYTEVFVLDQGKVVKTLLRCPLSLISQQLKKNPYIQQCHRSYIVNFAHVNRVSGNARDYNLHLDSLDFHIPVSRQFPKEILKSIKN